MSPDILQIGAGLGVGGLVLVIVLPWVFRTMTQMLKDMRDERAGLLNVITQNTEAFVSLKVLIDERLPKKGG